MMVSIQWSVCLAKWPVPKAEGESQVPLATACTTKPVQSRNLPPDKSLGLKLKWTSTAPTNLIVDAVASNSEKVCVHKNPHDKARVLESEVMQEADSLPKGSADIML